MQDSDICPKRDFSCFSFYWGFLNILLIYAFLLIGLYFRCEKLVL